MTGIAAPALDRGGLLSRLEAAWRRSDEIFDLLDTEALFERPIALRQPFIFYVGHLPAFGWNQILGGLLQQTSPRADLDRLFARGIDPVGVDAYQPAHAAEWPSLGEVLRYRDRVRHAIRTSFDDVEPLVGTDVLANHGRVYQLVIEHELMHHETLLYMVQQLDRRFVERPDGIPAVRFDGGAPPSVVEVPAGEVTLGADFSRVPFGWDNEFPEHVEPVEAFAVDRTPVRNSEWLHFLESGGYERRDLWMDDGWAWKERVGHEHPVFWVLRGDRWMYRTHFEEIPLAAAADWPVYVSWVEAAAYANWKGASLPTEAEFHRAAEGVPWGDAESRAGNFGFANWAPRAVGAYAEGRSRHGVLDLVGNGWEWTRSVFGPFPGFTPWARTYAGYSADFFDDRHYVILGASWATDDSLVRRSFRNWFQPHYPYVFAKFRCVHRS